jgi:hypothetical protein
MMFNRSCLLVFLLSTSTLSVLAQEQQPLDRAFFSLDFANDLANGDFSPKQGSSLIANLKSFRDPITGEERDVEELYVSLYALRGSRVIFMNALELYFAAVQKGASLLERDFRLNDVGQSAKDLYRNLGIVSEEFRQVGARLSLHDKELEAEVNGYLHSNTRLTGEDILRWHRLSTSDISALAEIVKSARANGTLLDTVLDELRLKIAALHPVVLKGKAPANPWWGERKNNK